MARRIFSKGGGIIAPIGDRRAVTADFSGNVGINQAVGNRSSVGVGANPINNSISADAATVRGSANYNAGVGINQEGGVDAGVGVGTRSGDQTYSAGVGVDAAGKPNASVGASTTQGSNTYSVGVGAGPQGISVGPRVQIGQTREAATGASVGGTAGSVVGGAVGAAFGGFGAPVGAAVGGAIGSAAGSVVGGAFHSDDHAAHVQRTGFRNGLRRAGFIDQNGQAKQPDGSTFNLGLEGSQGLHNYRDPSRRTGSRDGQLFSYDVDYTNDMDYVSYMAGNTLSRIMAGGKGKPIDQVGGQIGNQFLGNVGYSADMSQENFNSVMQNARAAYGRAGIQSKEDGMALINKMYADGRIDDADHAAAQQALSLVYDGNYNLAQQLMAGRWKGLEVASKKPGATEGGEQKSPQGSLNQQWQAAGGRFDYRGNRTGSVTVNGRTYIPRISPEEAVVSMQPWVDRYREATKKPGVSDSMNFAQAFSVGMAGLLGLRGIMNQINKPRTRNGGNTAPNGGRTGGGISPMGIDPGHNTTTVGGQQATFGGGGGNPDEPAPDFGNTGIPGVYEESYWEQSPAAPQAEYTPSSYSDNYGAPGSADEWRAA